MGKLSDEDVVVAEAQSDIEASLETKPKGSWFARAWGTSELDVIERKYVRKVDLYLFSYIMLGYFIKSLDQTNYSNAFVSGMKEDLNMYGNQRNFLTTYFNIGIIIGTVPAQMIQLKWIRPSILIPSCELAWSFLVMAEAGAKNYQTLYVLRFFIGFFESCSFPGYAALLGSWYGQGQLGKRIGLFEQAGALSSMFAGYLQAALYSGLNHRGGLAGWRWMFIFNAIIGIPIAIWGYWAIPDLPHNKRAFYFTEEECEYGVKRMERIGRAAPRKLTWKSIKRIYTSWHLWAFIFPYLMVANAGLGPSFFNLWLKAEKYSVVLVNTIPTTGSALQVIFAISFGTIADLTGQRKHTANVVSVLTLVTNIILSIWYVPKGALWFAFFFSFVSSSAQPIIIAWGHEITQHDAELRQLLVATGNIFTYIFSATMPLAIFPAQDAPHYKYAYQLLCMFGVLAIMGTYLLDYLYKKEL
ncbi:MFS general substrate transporter [Hyaloscypha variabilis F]|uniref:MFS general substrate transporter n=1 Tax=Hyaloscypha variabilis (strain UAMH 11265 / GT02V1 / F) TaxID=1149755 RepID=A0A2J6QV10_HYAVF|nr:MFS general substrate transporter [Hyaloscypha variabilis F]